MNPDDLDRATLQPLLGARPLRTFPAMLSTEAEALAWARQGAPHGSLVVTGYQAAPRGRSGLSWAERFAGGDGLGCSLVLRLALPDTREGWPYLPVLLAVRDVLAADGRREVEWPDRVVDDEGATVAAIGVQSEPVAGSLRWTVVTLLVPDVVAPRGRLLAALVERVDERVTQPATMVLDDYRAVCATLRRRVVARLLPMGPASPSLEGTAVDLVDDGGLTLATDDGSRMVIAPGSLGFLERPDVAPPGPSAP